jgi:hypothetical protein
MPDQHRRHLLPAADTSYTGSARSAPTGAPNCRFGAKFVVSALRGLEDDGNDQ